MDRQQSVSYIVRLFVFFSTHDYSEAKGSTGQLEEVGHTDSLGEQWSDSESAKTGLCAHLCHVLWSLVPLCLHTKDDILECQTTTKTGEDLVSDQLGVGSVSVDSVE